MNAESNPLSPDSGGSAPRFSVRALKVNLPWASYRQHRSLDLHDDVQRRVDYWERLLDFMAECRFNLISLWSLHPFHFMVMIPEFPEAQSYSDEEMDEWQRLWRAVFAMAHERGIQAHVFFWNIFVSPAFARAHDVARYSLDWSYIGDGDQSQIVKDYNRACVRELVDTYEDLDGIGVAMSERMGGMTPEERAKWIEEVTLAGIGEAGRPVDLCLRIPHSAGLDNGGSTSRESEFLGRNLLERTKIRGKLWTEIKFNWSHGHSTPHLRKIHGGAPTDVLWNPTPEKYEISWMVRNEDFFVLRWADPDFVREHIRLNGKPGVCGYFTGSECYIPAEDYISQKPREGRYAFERQWLFYQVWGKLLYDPSTPDSRFEALIDRRYGDGVGRHLFPAMKLASRVPHRIAVFLNFTWDHTLYAEGFLIRKGLATVEDVIDADPVEPDWLSVNEFLDAGEPDGNIDDRMTPMKLAEQLESEVREAVGFLEPLDTVKDRDLVEEVTDVRAWALLGRYFAGKLRAAVHLARFRRNGDREEHTEAVRLLEGAVECWRELAELTDQFYRPIPLQILEDRPFSWKELLPDVERDLHDVRAEVGK